MHDVNAFMKVKPQDLGPECVSFRKKGFCPYSFACRFGSDHLTQSEEKGKNQKKIEANWHKLISNK